MHLSATRRPQPLPPMAYPNAYVWLVFLSAMDIMLTWLVLHLGGSEVNYIARAVIHTHDLWGLIVFKFSMVVLAVMACEALGRRKPSVGRHLSEWLVALTAIPVTVAYIQIVQALWA